MSKRQFKLKDLGSFFRSIKSDFRSITWGKPREVLTNWVLVIAISGFASAVVFGFDMLSTVISRWLFF